jgi:hypothetical protein
MQEARKKRLAILEQAAGLQQQARHAISITFPGLDATFCDGSDGFVAYRKPFETLDDFMARAEAEALAWPRPKNLPPPILVFLGDAKKAVDSMPSRG